jgi:Methane oxygenase PmoA
MKRLLPFLFTLLSGAALAGPAVSAKREGTQVVFRAGEKEMFRYHGEPAPLPRPDIKEAFRRGGYLHPLYTPSGKLVSDDYPPQHIHHHGVWWAWTKTKFEDREPDFWNMGQNKGRVEFVALDEVWERDGTAGLKARHRFVDLLATPPKTALFETWEIRATSAADEKSPRYIIDFTSTQTCAGEAPLKLPKYHYGGIGFRGHRSWDHGNTPCEFLTSEGITDRIKGNESHGKWLWTGGPVDGSTVGLTILCHPKNFRFPQPMRLNPTEPFVCFAPQQDGDMEIKPGEPYVSRYRLVITDGKPSREEADAWWKEFAETAKEK